MKEQFVTYEIALAVKELGFDEECIAFWFNKEKKLSIETEYRGMLLAQRNKNSNFNQDCNYLSAPLWQQVIDWFRITHKIFIEIPCVDNFYDYKNDSVHSILVIRWENKPFGRFDKLLSKRVEYTNTEKLEGGKLTYGYNQAREQAILKAIKIINENMVK